ncbi:MAG: ribosomal L7Ae/L30e/S12e/Gadd45 family protein [bacterium]
MVNRKLLSMLSLCQKAGKMTSGEVSVEKNIQSGMALYVIVPKDASDNTIEKFKNKTDYYEVDFCIFGEKEILSQSIGKVNRTVFGITDENFAKKIKEYIKIIEEQE